VEEKMIPGSMVAGFLQVGNCRVAAYLNHVIHLTPTCAGFRNLAIANQAPAFIKFSGRGRGR